jgi:hypothetical protein
LIVAGLGGGALAGPPDPSGSDSDRDATPPSPNGTVENSPWLDLAPQNVLQATTEPAPDHHVASAIEFGSIYAAFSVWAYFAWYRNHPELDPTRDHFGGDGWFGKTTYAGGADKFGHAWATMVLARGGTAILDHGGWNHTRSALLSAFMADMLFLGVEVKDYYYYEFSPGDFTMDTAGAVLGAALDLFPRLDELVDFRVQYWPSPQYVKNLDPDSSCSMRVKGMPSCSRLNIAEDYSGETYLLALHLGGLHVLPEWSKFIDVVGGFDSRHYKPPEQDLNVTRTQQWFLGVSLNAQGVFDYLLHGTPRKVTHGLFEVFNLPYTSVPVIETTRTTNTAVEGGA